ncbi:DNA polymerase beta [Colletotrichum tofieldiae]|nr:DNA polymerase beta [Colletotrichum tofieldiae]
MVLELPPIYILATHLKPDELHDLEGNIPSLTYNIQEAEIIIGNISKRERALFELRRGKVYTDPVDATDITGSLPTTPLKRKRTSSESDSDSTVYTEDGDKCGSVPLQPAKASSLEERAGNSITVKVVKLAWLTDSLAQGKIVPFHNYLLYEGYKKNAPRHQSL